MAIKVVKKDKAKVLYSRIKNSSGADLTIDGQTLPDGEQVEEGKPNSAGFRFKFIKPRYIETSGNTIVDLMHFGRIPRSQSGYVGLLNEYPGAAFAASVRLLDSTYTDGLLRVRAFDGASDQGTADVLPDPNENYFISLNSTITNLDATATGRGLTTSDTLGDLLSSGVSNYDGFITTWFDQSGNANDATQGTAASQPQIASSGNLILENGKPALGWDGINTTLTIPNLQGQAILNIFRVQKQESNRFVMLSLSSGLGDRGFTGELGSSSSGLPANFGTPQLYKNGVLQSISTRNDTYNAFLNQNLHSVINANTTAWSDFAIGGTLSFTFRGNVQEFTGYITDKSSDRTDIETNINNAFTIY